MRPWTDAARGTLTLVVALMAGCAPADDGTGAGAEAPAAGEQATDAQAGAGKEAGATVEPGEQAAAVEAIALARQLADYGERTQSPMALIASAQILMDTPTQPLEGEPESQANEDQPTGEAPADDKTSAVESAQLDPAQLLTRAESMAGDNEHVRALVEQLKARAQTAARGAVGGARQGFYRVDGLSTNYHRIDFRAREYAVVCIDGDNDTDLDLFVRDENNNLIGSSRGYSDYECVDWVPEWTGEFRIYVANLGWLYNNYELATN